MPRGGARAGAGRKPKAQAGGGNVVDFPGGAAANAPAADVSPLAEPPADLLAALVVAEAAAVAAPSTDRASLCASLTARINAWRRLAPLALEQSTLTPSTVPGFLELCEQIVLKEDLHAKIARFGNDSETGRQRFRDYTKIAQRVDASLARFKLTAFGKPDDDAGAAAKKTAANPFAQLA